MIKKAKFQGKTVYLDNKQKVVYCSLSKAILGIASPSLTEIFRLSGEKPFEILTCKKRQKENAKRPNLQ